MVNALLVLLQLALIGRLYGTLEASRFFVFWTVIWAASVGVRFGYDQLLPKRAAAATLSDSLGRLAGYRRVAKYSLPIVAVITAPLLVAVLPDTSPLDALVAIPVVMLGAVGWAVVYLCSALARGYGHSGLSGWIGGPIAIVLATCAVPVIHTVGDSWLALGLASSIALALSAGCAVGLVSNSIGWQPTRAALIGRSVEPLDRDTWSIGALTGIAEVNIVLPIWIAGVLGVSATEIGALYGALRVAAMFSWIFTSVVALITPMLAEALARRDYARLRELIWRSAKVGAGATVPAAVVGVLISGQLLGLLNPAYRGYGDLLVVLIGARLLDAATGAVAEALILGDHGRWELLNQLLSSAALIAAAILLEPGIGVLALAIAAALSVIVANLARVAEVRWLMDHRWRTSTAMRAT